MIRRRCFAPLNVDENLQLSKRVLQCVCAIAGVILGGGFVLVCPAAAGAGIVLAGTGPTVAGVALASGATGGCIIAPFVHERINHAIIQQIQNVKAKEGVSKKVE